MKQRTLIYLLLSSFLYGCQEDIPRQKKFFEPKKPMLHGEELKGGKIKEVTLYTGNYYTELGQNIIIEKESSVLSEIYSYDIYGNQIEDRHYTNLFPYPVRPNWEGFTEVNRSGSVTLQGSIVYGRYIDEYYRPTDSVYIQEKTVYRRRYNKDKFQTYECFINLLWDDDLNAFKRTINKEEIDYDEYNCVTSRKNWWGQNDTTGLPTFETHYTYDNHNRVVIEESLNKGLRDEKKTTKYRGNMPWQQKTTTIDYESKDKEVEAKKESDYIGNKFNDEFNALLVIDIEKYPSISVERYPSGNVKKVDRRVGSDRRIIEYSDHFRPDKLSESKFRNDEWIDTDEYTYRRDRALLKHVSTTSRVVGKSYYKKVTTYKRDALGNWYERIVRDDEGVLSMEFREFDFW